MSRHQYPKQLYTAEQARKIDRLMVASMDREAKSTSGLAPRTSAYRLMLRAGEAVVGYLLIRDPKPEKILIVCGAGNNAGDGYVIAKLAKLSGLRVDVIALLDPKKLQGEAQLAVGDWEKAGGDIAMWNGQSLAAYDCIIDALLGIGITRDLSGDYAEVVTAINLSSAFVIAVDIPSGLNADSGMAMPFAVQAELTVTFIVMKKGLLTGSARDYVGDIIFNDLGVVKALYSDFKPAAYCIDDAHRMRWLGPRKKTAHKGDNGHVLVVGGEVGMSGAAIMAGKAALRAGAGLVSIASRSQHAAVMNSVFPELMCYGVETVEELKRLLGKASVVIIGPGLGQSHWAKVLLEAVLASHLPVVVDADGLNLLAQEGPTRSNWVLTPHPGEAARLLHIDSQAVQLDRHYAITALVEQYQAVVVLKGAASIVAQRGEPHWICDRGNPGMATAGMGDILSGVIAGLIAQDIPLLEAVKLAVLIHACAADLAAHAQGERGLNASDLFPRIQGLVNPAAILSEAS